MAHLFLPGTGRPSLSAKFSGGCSAWEQERSGLESLATELLGAGVLTSLFSRLYHRGPIVYLVRLLSG